MKSRNTTLICIDPQNDFCIPNGPGNGQKGSLVVAGADKDMERLANFIIKNKRRIDQIHCTLDSHQLVHIAHPSFWVNSKGQNPSPFTLITEDDVKNGVWRSYNPAWQSRAVKYVETLKANGRYVFGHHTVSLVLGGILLFHLLLMHYMNGNWILIEWNLSQKDPICLPNIIRQFKRMLLTTKILVRQLIPDLLMH